MRRVAVIGSSGSGKSTFARALADGLGVPWLELDAVVWLDLSRARTMWRVTSRSIRRVVTREELWNGNREVAAARGAATSHSW